jgi:hypothetical protein
MKTLITLTLLSLSTITFAGSVGETSTECFKNQSSQSRGSKEVVKTETETSKENESATIDQ